MLTVLERKQKNLNKAIFGAVDYFRQISNPVYKNAKVNKNIDQIKTKKQMEKALELKKRMILTTEEYKDFDKIQKEAKIREFRERKQKDKKTATQKQEIAKHLIAQTKSMVDNYRKNKHKKNKGTA